MVQQPRVAPPARAEDVDDDLLELVPGRRGRRRALVAVLLHHPRDPGRQPRVDIWHDRAHGRDRLGGVAHQDRHRRVDVVERPLPGQQLEREAAGAVEIGPRPDVRPHRLLGRHVGRRADHHPGGRPEGAGAEVGRRLGDPEVGDLHAPVRAHQHVLGLEVPVHDPGLLGGRQPRQHALEHARDLRQVELADERPQRPALDVLHRQVRDALVLEVLVDRDHVRVGERARQPRLAQEALGVRRVLPAERAQLLERDQPLQVGLAREMHDRHAALAQDAQHLVAADRQRHFVVGRDVHNRFTRRFGQRFRFPRMDSTRRSFIRGIASAGASSVAAVALERTGYLDTATALAQTAPPSDFSAFRAIAASAADAFEVPEGYRARTIIGYGDQVLNEDGTVVTYGYNNDFLAYFPLNGSDEGLLFINHEYPAPFFQHGVTAAAAKTSAAGRDRAPVGRQLDPARQAGRGRRLVGREPFAVQPPDHRRGPGARVHRPARGQPGLPGHRPGAPPARSRTARAASRRGAPR